MSRRKPVIAIPSTLTVARALEIISAKSQKWAATYNETTGTVECIKTDFARRSDGTIIGANSGEGFRVSSFSRRSVLEVAAEIEAKAEAKAARVASQRELMAQDVANAQARIAVLEGEIAELVAAMELISNPIVRNALESGLSEKRQRIVDEQAHIARLQADLNG